MSGCGTPGRGPFGSVRQEETVLWPSTGHCPQGLSQLPHWEEESVAEMAQRVAFCQSGKEARANEVLL